MGEAFTTVTRSGTATIYETPGGTRTAMVERQGGDWTTTFFRDRSTEEMRTMAAFGKGRFIGAVQHVGEEDAHRVAQGWVAPDIGISPLGDEAPGSAHVSRFCVLRFEESPATITDVLVAAMPLDFSDWNAMLEIADRRFEAIEAALRDNLSTASFDADQVRIVAYGEGFPAFLRECYPWLRQSGTMVYDY